MIPSVFNYIIKQVGGINHHIFGSTWVKKKNFFVDHTVAPHDCLFKTSNFGRSQNYPINFLGSN